MEDHMASSETMGSGSSSVAVATDSLATDPDLRVLCSRVKVLEQKAGSTIQSDSQLRNRELKRNLLVQLCQRASASQLPSMQHSQRLDQRLHVLRQEVRTMTQERERGERVWRERLQRCQRQLKAKEQEMGRQSQYFENFKAQLQHKLSLSRDREQSLQNRIYTLEKQLLDMNVSAATGMATISAVRITAGTLTLREKQEKLTSMRGEGEGEEERKEERMKQWQPSVFAEREGGREGEKVEGQSSNESWLQGFILSLQEDLRVLLERGEEGMTERRGLMEQLQEAQEHRHFLGCKVEELKAEVHQLKLSERSLMEEVEELREENVNLPPILGEAANQTPSRQSPSVPEPARPLPGTSSPSRSPAVCPGPSNCPSNNSTAGLSSVGSSGEVQPTLNQSHSSAVAHDHHQVAAEIAQNRSDSGPEPEHNLSFQPLTLTIETIDGCKPEPWFSGGLLNLEESLSEESDALREAYRSLGLGDDLEALGEQRDRLQAALQHTQEQLEVVAQQNTQLKLQLRKQAVEHGAVQHGAVQGSSREKIKSPPTQDNDILTLAQDDLVHSLNQENQALADRIQELLAHIELREAEMETEEGRLRERASRSEEERARQEQENQEQGCLITELTMKTEDDLNTIMELQQKLEEFGQLNNFEDRVDSLVERVLKEEEPHLTSSQQLEDSITASAPGSQHNNPRELLQNSPRNTLPVSSLNDQVDRLTKAVQSLRAEQDELTVNVRSLREQRGEVALSVQTQTEEKQQLTRTVWGLKEEKDGVSQCLAGLRHEREQLTRTVCELKGKQDHFIRSVSGLKEEKEQLTTSLSGLKREREALTQHLSSGKEERDQITQSLQSLQTERDQLSGAVLDLKAARGELTASVERLTGQRDREQSPAHTPQDGRDTSTQSLSTLRDEKERVERSIAGLKHEEEQMMLSIQGLREERRSDLQSALRSQTQTRERSPRQQLSNPTSADSVKTTETGDCAAQGNQPENHRENSVQEQSDLLREIEALGEQLKRSQEELDKSHVGTQKLHSDLCQSEARREEAERAVARAAEKVMRLTEAVDQMEETRMENVSLCTQVKVLQGRLTGLVREKTDALSLKTQIEKQYSILTAQLKAKTVALEELNCEYIALKRGRGNKDDLSASLISVRTRYDDIREKYDALLKKRSQTDLDVTLKAKLSCLVVKCQERNNLLVQMMKVVRRQGGVDPALQQQVERLLSDAPLQDYTAAFTPGIVANTRDRGAAFTQRFLSDLQDCAGGFPPDQTRPAAFTPANQQTRSGFTPASGVKSRDPISERHVSKSTAESSTNPQDCGREVTPAATATLMRNDNSSAPAAPARDKARVPALTQSWITKASQPTPSAIGPIQTTIDLETCGYPQSDVKGKSSPDLTGPTESSPAPPSSGACVGPSRRLSSPEKIINLHEQLQRTLMSSFQAPGGRGRGQEPRKSLSFSAPSDLNLTCQTNEQRLSFNSLPVNPTSSQDKPAAANKSTTLFNAVASRSADVKFSTNICTHRPFKADASKTTTSLLSSNEARPPSDGGADTTVSPEMTTKLTAISNTSDATLTAPSNLWTNNFGANVSMCSDTNPKSTASDTTAPGESTAPKFNMCNGAAPAHGGLGLAASWTQPGHCSPGGSSRSARKSTAALDKTKAARPRPGAPAEVRSVEVIKTVGQSSLLIGWERPTLDELGCSGGTFVYGYRIFIDGDFHKSVMSSACTKCIVENVDLSVSVHISVQTLGSNGLSSNSVHTVYRTSDGTDQR